MSEDTANTHSDGGLSRRSLLTGSTALVAAAAAIGAQSQAVAQAQAPAQAPAASPRKPPNILVIFGDDIGIPQISAYTMGLMGSFPPLSGERVVMTGIPGNPPDLNQPPTGCRFHPRCPYAADVCVAEIPTLRVIGLSDRRAACHFAGELPT